jgi:opacity protein-like surface antigen
MKSLIILAFVILVPTLSVAQTKVGLMGSALYNTFENSRLDDQADSQKKSATSFGGGIRAIVNITDHLLLRTGAQFVQKKFTADFTGPTNEGQYDYNLSYLSIPATIYVPAGAQFAVFFGTAIQARMGASCSGTVSGQRCRVEDDKALVFPAILGFDLAMNEHLSLEVSYEYGLTPVMRDTRVSSAVVSLIWNL